MKVLVVSDVKTHPTDLGSSRFIVSYCELLQSLGHEVYFLYISRYALRRSFRILLSKDREETKKHWRDHYLEYEESVFSFIRRKLLLLYRKIFSSGYIHCDDKYYLGLAKFAMNNVKRLGIDACMVNYFWLTKVLCKLDINKKAIFTHDAYTYYALRNPQYFSEMNLSPTEEAKALQRCDYIFAIQDDEATLFKYLAPQSVILKSYCSYHITIQQRVGNHNILFLSSDWHPNILGLKWFVKEVLPNIKEVYPDCKLLIGGSICRELDRMEMSDNVEILGYIEDASLFYQKGDIVINPTYSGAGLKIKTFEAISYGKIVIAHPHCLEGAFCKDKAPILIATSSNEWVENIKRCWEDSTMIFRFMEMDREYLDKMNQFIIGQYDSFLKDN